MTTVTLQKKAAARVHKAVQELKAARSDANNIGVTVTFSTLYEGENLEVTKYISPFIKTHCTVSIDPETEKT